MNKPSDAAPAIAILCVCIAVLLVLFRDNEQAFVGVIVVTIMLAAGIYYQVKDHHDPSSDK